MSETMREITGQPACWEQAVERAALSADVLPTGGERIAVVGCGTSWFMAQAYAAWREASGHGEADAFTASEFSPDRPYDRLVAISRSGTTTEVARLVEQQAVARPVTAITAVAGTPVPEAATDVVVLEFADEVSVVQTRFATTALALLRAGLGEDLSGVITDGRAAVVADLPADPAVFDHFVFLGHGGSVGLANEAALKMREAARAHAEAYPAMEYRHGPISLAGPSSLVWILGSDDAAVATDIRGTGATVVEVTRDPMAELIRIQRTAVALAEARGLDPDHPRNLTRSVIFPEIPR